MTAAPERGARTPTEDMHARGFCPRCLLGDIPGGEELARQMEAWINAIPPERRADGSAAAERLAACRGCPHLADGLCGLCGCYVELRVAKREQRCPDVPPRWK